MSKYNNIELFYSVVQMFEKKEVLLSEIKKKLKSDKGNATEESFQKAIRRIILKIEKEYDVKILYSKKFKSYIATHAIKADNPKSNILGKLANLNSLNQAILQNDILCNYIDFDKISTKDNASFLSIILKAIEQKKWIVLEYENFRDLKSRTHLVAPVLIKEHKNRWYLYAVLEAKSKAKPTNLLPFGLERIKSIVLSERPIKNVDLSLLKIGKKKFHYSLINQDIIGITNPEQQAEIVELRFTKNKGFYIKSQPWHHSQIEISDDDSGYRIQIEVKINPELTELILGCGSAVEVLQPIELRNKIKQELLNTFNQYK